MVVGVECRSWEEPVLSDPSTAARGAHTGHLSLGGPHAGSAGAPASRAAGCYATPRPNQGAGSRDPVQHKGMRFAHSGVAHGIFV